MFFYKKRGSKRAIRFTTALIFTLQVFKRVLYSNGNEKQRGITMHQDVEKILVTEELNAIAHRLAKQITKDYEGKKLLLVGVLKVLFTFLPTLQDILIYRVILILFKLQVMVQVLYQAAIFKLLKILRMI